MLAPRKTKFVKSFKSNIYGLADPSLYFGAWGLISQTSGRVSASQLEAARRVISRYLKDLGTGSMWLRIFPYLPLTKKPNETRMGRGKGSVSLWYANIKVNQVLFELDHISYSEAQDICKLVNSKLSVQIKLNNK